MGLQLAFKALKESEGISCCSCIARYMLSLAPVHGWLARSCGSGLTDVSWF